MFQIISCFECSGSMPIEKGKVTYRLVLQTGDSCDKCYHTSQHEWPLYFCCRKCLETFMLSDKYTAYMNTLEQKFAANRMWSPEPPLEYP